MKINDTAAATGDNNKAFSIVATGKAFRILSDGLYSDKVSAVIRELSCNAYDSHVAAGKSNVPFEIQLPNNLDRRFRVTDFGTGISDEDIYKIYTQYFASTKTASNDFVGQLGLGSKSPFSIVREFFVLSRVNGIQRRYRMYFDDSDTPRVEFLDQLDCAANCLPPSGVTVEFTVTTNEQIEQFNSRADSVLRWFKTVPICVGNPKRFVSLIKNSGNKCWFEHGIVLKYSSANQLYAVMGNIAYPIDIDSLNNTDTVFNSLSYLPIAVKFDIGELEISASRESIGYDKRTVANIVNRLNTVLDDIRQTVIDRMASITNEWDARCYYHTIFGDSARHRHAYNDIFRGIILRNAQGIEIKSSLISTTLIRFYDASGNVIKGSSDRLTFSRPQFQTYSTYTQPCNHKQRVIFNDLERGGISRIRHWLSTEAKSAQNSFEFTIYNKPVFESFDLLRTSLGNVDPIYSSKLPALPKKTKELKTAKHSMLLFKNRKNGRNVWEEVDMDLSKGGYYVELVGKNVDAPMFYNIDLKDVMRWAVMLGLVDSQTVYAGRTPTAKRKLRNADNWINLMDYLTEKVNKFLIPAKFDKLATLNKWRDVKFKFPFEMSSAVHWKLRDNEGVMGRLIAFAKEMAAMANSGDVEKINHYIALARSIGVSVQNNSIPDVRVETLYNEYVARYPMLTIAQSSYVKTRDKEVADYVNMVDATHVWFAITDPALDNTEEA